MAEPTPTLPAASSLRLAVWHLRRDEGRRQFPPRLNVGVAGTERRLDFEELASDRLDAALRAEIAGALLSRVREYAAGPAAWLTRAGELTTHDADLAWLAAVEIAGAEVGLCPPFVVVTPRGWYDPRSSARQAWRRLRVKETAHLR